MRSQIAPLLALGLTSLGLAACATEPAGAAPGDLLAALQAIPGLTVAEQPSAFEGYRYFVLEMDQPADHDDPDGQRFRQRLTLHHRSSEAPVVLATSGYFIYPQFQQLNELTRLLDGNQLQVEHRFFTPSRPEPTSWSHLTIEQAAADHHRVVEALRPISTGAWISTGKSKGGMTSVYHRRFYPDDVDGTVAYVAPHTFETSDPRFIDFVAQLGEPACRQALLDFQRELLLRRQAMLSRMQDQAMDQGLTYDLLGEEQALEVAAVELIFTFWQYFDASRCPDVPPAAATDDEVWDFLDEIASPSLWADDRFLAFEPYFFQAATQLGYPAIDEANLADLLVYPGLDVPASFVAPGPGKEMVFDPASMQDISDWLSAEGERFLFVYGENDPYSAAAFDLGQAKDSYRFFVLEGNHGAAILDLEPAERATALDALETWTGVAPTP